MNKTVLIARVKLIALFGIMWCTSGFYRTIVNEAILIGICIFFGLLLILLSMSRGFIHFQGKSLFFLLFVFFTEIVAYIFSPWSINSLYHALLSWVAAFLFYCGFDSFDDFRNSFLQVMFLLALYSVIVYLLAYIVPSFIQLFPIAINSEGIASYNLGLSIQSLNKSHGIMLRNSGIFWEPGAYQIFLNIALILEIFSIERTRMHYAVVFVLALVTTISSTGLYVLFLTIIVVILLGRMSKKKKFLFSSVIVVFVIFYYVFLDKYFGDYMAYSIAGKFLEVGQNQAVESSLETRFNSIVNGVSFFFSSPLFGGGKAVLKKMNTFTPINWFSFYGFFHGIICLLSYINIAKLITSGKKLRYLIILELLVIVSTEQMVDNAFMNLLLFYGSAVNYKTKIRAKAHTSSEMISK